MLQCNLQKVNLLQVRRHIYLPLFGPAKILVVQLQSLFFTHEFNVPTQNQFFSEKYSNYILLPWLNLLLLQITSFIQSMYLNERIISHGIIAMIFVLKYRWPVCKWRRFLKLILHLDPPQSFLTEVIMTKMWQQCIYLSISHVLFLCITVCFLTAV